FGERLFLLKLWLFPLALALCFSSWSLLHRFARGTEELGTAMLALSPAILPLFNFMLDVPAVALGLSAVALFVRGCDRAMWRMVISAGIVAGVAAQTKYTMITLPAIFACYGLLCGRLSFALVSGLVGAAVFAGWEAYLLSTYGMSHFAFHVHGQQTGGDG